MQDCLGARQFEEVVKDMGHEEPDVRAILQYYTHLQLVEQQIHFKTFATSLY